tara:strand:- start:197 stop:415 length:219 start_codon:yes stop_codon:yes gene_type:complete
MIIIYGKEQCPYCDMAKDLVERKELEYQYKQLGKDFAFKDLVERFPTARTFPQIVMDGNSIGGYTELEKLIG